MPEKSIPECIRKRNAIFEEIIQELVAASTQPSPAETTQTNENIGKLMSDIWGILREKNNQCDNCHLSSLEPEVEQRNITIDKSLISVPKCSNTIVLCHTSTDKLHGSCKSQTPSRDKSSSSSQRSALCNLKEAICSDKQCTKVTQELLNKQQELYDEISKMELNDQNAMKRLKEADGIWAEMEQKYKQKVEEIHKRQKPLAPELKNIESNWTKWRKDKKKLEFELRTVTKLQEEIKDKMRLKTNDIKDMDKEIEKYKKRFDKATEDLERAKKFIDQKKKSADKSSANIQDEINTVTKSIDAERSKKLKKEYEGAQLVRKARRDIQEWTKAVMKLKLDRENLASEKKTLMQEKEILLEKYNNCGDICGKQSNPIEEEIKNLKKLIHEHTLKCRQCHQSTDTEDIAKCCTDCPRCQAANKSKNVEPCGCNHSLDCVCMSVKRKFVENVLSNMHTVLERKANSSAGKSIGALVSTCLKRSTNGKIDAETRGEVQNFIMTIVKKNLNLTIVGGAVKTRCEMDSETYRQLMLCLRDVPQPKPPCKEDKSVSVMKVPCERWGGTKECNCPKGPNTCICTRKSRLPVYDSTSPEALDEEEIEKIYGNSSSLSKTEGAYCAVAIGKPAYSQVSPEVSNTMKAAQCVLGPHPVTKDDFKTALPVKDKMMPCSRCSQACWSDLSRESTRQKIVEEVLGDFVDGTPTRENPNKLTCFGQVHKPDLKTTDNTQDVQEATDVLEPRVLSCDCSFTTPANALTSSYEYDLRLDNKRPKTCTIIDMAQDQYSSKKKTRGKKYSNKCYR